MRLKQRIERLEEAAGARIALAQRQTPHKDLAPLRWAGEAEPGFDAERGRFVLDAEASAAVTDFYQANGLSIPEAIDSDDE